MFGNNGTLMHTNIHFIGQKSSHELFEKAASICQQDFEKVLITNNFNF